MNTTVYRSIVASVPNMLCFLFGLPPIARGTHETFLSKYESFEFMWWGEKISKPLKMGAMSFCGCGFRTTPHIGAGAIALPKNRSDYRVDGVQIDRFELTV